jgi:hypothetical protein
VAPDDIIIKKFINKKNQKTYLNRETGTIPVAPDDNTIKKKMYLNREAGTVPVAPDHQWRGAHGAQCPGRAMRHWNGSGLF